MNKLPHEIREMCNDLEAAADFLQQLAPPFGDVGQEAKCLLMSAEGGEPWPIDPEEVLRWEQAIRNLKQMVELSK